MNSFFQSISIKLRFNLLIVSVVVVFTIIALFFVYSLAKVQNYRDYSAEVSDLEVEYLNLRHYEQMFLLRYEEDAGFFTTKQNKYIDKHNESAIAFDSIIEKLGKDEITAKLHLNDNFSKISSYHQKYNSIFEQLYSDIHKKGSNGTGVVGEMIKSSNNAYNAEKNVYLREYTLQLMQVSEKYLHKNSPKQYQEFLLLFSSLNQFISSDLAPFYRFSTDNQVIDSTAIDTTQIEQSNTVSEEFVTNINNFKYHFSTLFKIDTEIGFSYKEGLQGSLRSEIHNVDAPLKEVKDKLDNQLQIFINRTENSSLLFFGILMAIIVVLIWQFSNSILRPVNRLKSYISPLSRGSLPENITEIEGRDEISEMTLRVNELIIGLKQTTDFASAIGRGHFDTDYKPLSTDDVLGNSLLEMRQNLNQAQIDEEMRKREDDMRKWANEGLAKFNDILRQSSGNIEELAGIVIRELVHFLKANQGGVFVNNTDENEEYLELVAAYAYGQEKKKQKKIMPGEGLVGTAAIEKDTIYMTDIPESYITITSGLGGANPRSLLIVPMKVEDEIFGIIEIASFNEFNSNEIEFAEKVSETIAASLSITRINSRTAELLEQSQLAAEQMAVQEEEMRRNFDELKQTQEESAKREVEMSSILSAINSSSLVIEINTQGYITSVNSELLDILGLDEQDLIGKMHHDFVNPDDEKAYSEFWYKLKNGEYQKATEHIKIGNKEMWIGVTYTPIMDTNGEVQKILSLATDFTETKQLEIEMREQAEAMQAQEEEMRQNLEELHSTQEEMAKKQAMLEKANMEAKTREIGLKEASAKAFEQERELQIKVSELNTIKEQLEEEHARMIDLNNELAIKETETSTRFNAIDKNNLVAEYEINGTVKYANNLFLETFGYSLRDVKQRHHRMFVHEDERKATEYKQFWNNLRDGQSFENECRRVDKDGEVLYFKSIFTPIKDIHGNTYKILEILSNITLLKRTDANIKSRMSNINLTNAMVEISKHKIILDVNALFAEATGFTQDELIGMDYTKLIDPEMLETEAYDHFWRDLKRGKITGGIWHFVTKDNTKMFFQGTFSPTLDPQGLVEKIMFLGLDVTTSVTQSEEMQAKETEYQHNLQKMEELQKELDAYKAKYDKG